MKQLTKKEWLSLGIILLPNLMISLNTYMLQVALPEIQQSLVISFNDAKFILTGYSLGLAVFLIISSFLGNRFGQKKILLIGVSMFLILSIIGGYTSSSIVLMIVRIGQGISGALIQPQVMILMREGFSKEQQQLVFAVYGMVIGLGFTFGLLLGGIIMELNIGNLGWRNIFYFNVPICLIILLLNQLIPPKEAITSDQLDKKGSILLILGSFLLAYHIIYFSSMASIGFITLGLFIIGIFYYIEKVNLKESKTTLVDVRVFKEKGFIQGLLSVFSAYFSMFGLFFLITYYAQDGLGKSVFETGYIFLPLGVGFTLASISSSYWLRKIGNKLLLFGILGMIISLGALIVTISFQEDLFTLMAISLLFVYGLFLGVTTTPLIGIVLMNIKDNYSALASSLINMTMYIANIVGVAILGSLFQSISLLTEDFTIGFQSVIVVIILTLILTSFFLYKLIDRKRV